MNINTRAGSKVKFAYPENGTYANKRDSEKYLKFGAIYTVEWTDVHDFYTDVRLAEIPGIDFNSVLFKNVRKKRILPEPDEPRKRFRGKVPKGVQG